MSMSGSRYSGYCMRGRPPPRSLCGDHLLVRCILPCPNSPICDRLFRACGVRAKPGPMALKSRSSICRLPIRPARFFG